jgi:hypothetical protein
MLRLQANKIIKNLKNHPGEWVQFAELGAGKDLDKLLQGAGMDTRVEYLTGRLFSRYARCPLPAELYTN